MRVGIAALVLAMAIGNAVAQDKPVELKFSHWVPATHPIVKASEQWADSIKKASNGTINITMYPAQQLGKAFDHYDMARDGIADIAYANPGYTPGRFPVIAAGELPFLLANGKEGSAALDSWYRKYAPKEMSEVKFCLAFVHDPGTFHSTKKKIVVPSDLAGMKIRPAGATSARFITLLGGANVQASAVEARGHPGKERRRWNQLPVGLDRPVRDGQGAQISYGRCALYERADVGDEQSQIRRDVAGTEKGDR